MSKSKWQANLKRIYLFTDVNDAESKNLDYTTEGKFSIRSVSNNSVIFTGQNITKRNVASYYNASRIIDPVRQAEAVKKDSNLVAVNPEVDALEKNFSVYPNPIDNSQSEITLDLEDFEVGKEIQLSLFDGQGRQVKQQSFTLKDKQRTVGIPHLTSGMYFIKLNEKDKQYSKKLLVR